MPTFSLPTQCAPMVEDQEINSSNNSRQAGASSLQNRDCLRIKAARTGVQEGNISIITTFAIMFVIKTPDCSYEWFMWIN